MVRGGYFSLHLKVAIGRMRLEELARKYGRQDPRVIKFSQGLDRDVAELQRRMLYAG